MSEPLRQPLTIWQWITGQPGTIYTPPPPPGPESALDYIERELQRIYDELDDIRDDEYVAENRAYHKLVDAMTVLHAELVRRSQEESK